MTREELVKYCNENDDVIFVRGLRNGRWNTLSFSQLTDEEKEKWITDWLKRDMRPSRVNGSR